MTEPEIPSQSWRPEPRCCWCGARFVLSDYLARRVWVCPTPACFERQRAWEMLDIDGGLFYLPMPKQVELEEAIASQQFGAICLGGSRGGGKSLALRRVAQRYCRKYHDFSVIFLRRTFPELELNHMKFCPREAKRLGAKYTNKKMTFPETDSEIQFGHCQDPDDYKNYIGGECDLLDLDQIEMFTEKQVTEISASVGRIRRDDWRGLLLAGENPGGPISAFVDELFISKTRDQRKYPDYDPATYHFIPAQLEDNAWVSERYVDFLAGIEPIKRDMYRFGRRDVFPGQFFPEFPAPDRIQEFSVPRHIPRLGALHWAYQKPGIFLWCVVLPDGRLYVEREYPFQETIASDLAIRVVELTKQLRVMLSATWGNPVTQDDQIGEDPFETFHAHGLTVFRADHDPVSGWQRIQHWLRPLVTPSGSKAALIVSPACSTVIKTLPQLMQLTSNPEVIDDNGPTFAAKALRYLVMSRPNIPKPLAVPSGRDWSKVDARTREDIERVQRYEHEHDPKPVSLGLNFFPDAESVEPW